MSISPRELLRAFQTAIETRTRREAELSALTRQTDPRLLELQHALREAERVQHESAAATVARFEAERAAAISTHAEVTARIDRDYDSEVRQIVRTLDAETGTLERQHSDSAWVVSSLMDDDADDSPLRAHERFMGAVTRSREEHQTGLQATLDRLQTEADRQGRRLEELDPEPAPAPSPEAAHDVFVAAIRTADDAATELKKLLLPKVAMGWSVIILFLALGAILSATLFFAVQPTQVGVSGTRYEGPWLMVAASIGSGIALVISLFLYTFASMAQGEVFHRWQQAVANAKAADKRWESMIDRDVSRREAETRKLHSQLESQRVGALTKYQQTYESRIAELRSQREQGLAAAAERKRMETAEADRIRTEAVERIDRQLEEFHEAHDRDSFEELERLKTAIADRMTARQREQSSVWSALKMGWEKASAELASNIDQAQTTSRQTTPDWPQLASPDFQRPEVIPNGIRIGEYDVHLEKWTDAISTDMRLAPRKTSLRLPAVLDFPERPSLLLKSRSATGRAASLPILQTAMLRLLTSLPPGTVRFTLLDPVGLGDSFAGFMHLADVDEALVTSRIWTEPSQIEARLADLTEHMENVLQTYLRNEFPTLEDYNRHAGEVAEPYRIVVIRDFPAKFSEIAARRLTSVITAGPRCGVYVLMSVDGKLQLPNNFDLAQIEAGMNVFEWREERTAKTDLREMIDGETNVLFGLDPSEAEDPSQQPVEAFYATDPELSKWPLVADAPPEPDVFSKIVKGAGAAARGARRVEVSFDRIAPTTGERWTQDSRRGLDVPMGRAGAVKLQHVRLGQGTSQHMLIAGKTGSGKSTFLHGMITNLALYYGPDQLQFFLIDFKKGVEFKDYAAFQLPHARVIAIESDREFGVSALMRLDELMQERGELFRRQGVQDVAGFRNANPDVPLPRILLVIDEFQEFFTEDDKYSQTAALLLDRLVRQGRAFGVHVILGSQTLGGAYSLARSTLGQVAVRVALQCSEADAHLILSEDNTAARLLSRPGEAIYNDANGLVEGNHPFQIAWLPDDKREQYLRELHDLADLKGFNDEPPLVFEGSVPSDLAQNVALAKLIDGEAEPARRTAPRIWLGDAVEIGAPTSIALERQASANLLIVGQDAEAVQGLLTAAAIALAAQSSEADDTPRLWLFDGSASDDPVRAIWSRLADSLGGRLKIVMPNQAIVAIEELTAERLRRDANRDELAPSICVLVYNVSRFRDLRKSEDEFSFGGYGGEAKPASPSKQFSELLASGPDLGMHALIWADSYNNVERWFSRQALREFEFRVLFPMNAADSSNLVDSPQAAKLGPGRALLYREDRGTMEKFRPYAVPDEAFLRRTGSGTGAEPIEDLPLDLEGFTIS
jgi:hypothetical protein